MSDNNEIKRELFYKSWHRGCKETDIILGGFAKKGIEFLSDDDLKVYAKFIEEDDWEIYAWIAGNVVPPEKYIEITRKIVNCL